MTVSSNTLIAAAEELHVSIGPSSLGLVLVAHSAAGVRAVLLGDDHAALWSDLRTRFPNAELIEVDAYVNPVAADVIAFVNAPEGRIEATLDLVGSEFQRAVWRELQTIPAGSTVSYTEIAQRIGRPTAARAVAHACATNPVAVIIPCHRVVASDGALSGYRWGIERKRALLEREAAA